MLAVAHPWSSASSYVSARQTFRSQHSKFTSASIRSASTTTESMLAYIVLSSVTYVLPRAVMLAKRVNSPVMATPNQMPVETIVRNKIGELHTPSSSISCWLFAS